MVSAADRRGRRDRLLIASAAVAGLVALAIAAAVTLGDGGRIPPIPPGIPSTTSGIGVALTFNYYVAPAAAERGVDFAWASQYPRGPGRTYDTYYVTYDRD